MAKGSAAAKAWGAKMREKRKKKNDPYANNPNADNPDANWGIFANIMRTLPKRKSYPKMVNGVPYVPGSGITGMTHAQYIRSPLARQNLSGGGRRAGQPYVMRKCRKEAQNILKYFNRTQFRDVADVKKKVNLAFGRTGNFGLATPRQKRSKSLVYAAPEGVNPLPSLFPINPYGAQYVCMARKLLSFFFLTP